MALQCYGELMQPLDLAGLLDQVGTPYRNDPVVLRWLCLADRVARAEFVACWPDWTPEQAQAYGNDDWRLFSRLRGYSDAEIEEFAEYLELTEKITLSYQAEDLCASLDFLIHQLVATPELEAANAHLLERARQAETGDGAKTFACES